MPRAEIGELTDWHVWELYIWPEVVRARRQDGSRAGDGFGRRGKKTRLPTKEEYIATGERLGGDRDDLGKAYDQWAASEEGKRALEGR